MNEIEAIRKELRLMIRELGLLSHNCLNSGMTLAQVHVLSYLKKNGITPFSELLQQLGTDKASLSRILNNLASKYYVKVEQSNIDKRMKCVDIQPLGIQAMETADLEANKFISEIFNSYDEDILSSLIESLRAFHMLALKKNLNKNDSRIILERIPLNCLQDAIKLATEVFTYEQNIPEELMPIKEDLMPIWWCARVGEEIIGIAASWIEENEWHWGRFAVDRRLRGLGIGKKIAMFSINETFNLGAEKIFIEAKDITVKMLEQFGCEVVGKAVEFYGEPVTPIIIEKSSFINTYKNIYVKNFV
ncbi:MarR family transcriptional regulator [Clostridium polyendosporum]|uniref:MarR family transcriptional regulator n=1 Tax=Clostridium polyendosporum TaxID=69208 RepID=A0A919VE95_9CLOT|nr:bifunctional helix-turn-helix transcriptional regulator/GNAT family N-acetyltransferase [Clostridium polyendosporum]GIM28904.1 MarR family transcriptional regulator [Clostridium polyendosporum]